MGVAVKIVLNTILTSDMTNYSSHISQPQLEAVFTKAKVVDTRLEMQDLAKQLAQLQKRNAEVEKEKEKWKKQLFDLQAKKPSVPVVTATATALPVTFNKQPDAQVWG